MDQLQLPLFMLTRLITVSPSHLITIPSFASGDRHWQPPCIWGVGGKYYSIFHIMVLLFILTNFIIAILFIRTFALDGKIVIEIERASFNESRGQRMIIRGENYFTDKYELTRTHEVLAVKVVKPGKTLDLGCGGQIAFTW